MKETRLRKHYGYATCYPIGIGNHMERYFYGCRDSAVKAGKCRVGSVVCMLIPIKGWRKKTEKPTPSTEKGD